MKMLAIVAVSVLAFACGAKKNADESKIQSAADEKIPKTMDIVKVTARTGEFVKNSDPVISIDTVEVRGNIMYIDVTYGGGCEQHEFDVIGSLAIAKSYPPIRSIQLVHYANGDKCRALQQVKLEVYLDEISYKQEEGSEIYYTLEGWEGRIYHKYAGK